MLDHVPGGLSLRAYRYAEQELDSPDIAIVGMAARLPEARNIATFFQHLRDGRECLRTLSRDELVRAGVHAEDLNSPRYVRRAAIFPDLELFDARFFGLSAREASLMDPQHRHFLEVCWEALEDAGLMPEAFDAPIGVFAGSGMNAYMPYHLFTNPGLMRDLGLFLVRHTGNDKDFLATRVAYCLNLRGPAVNVQTACSTSLVAIHMACQSLLSGECALALAGGVTLELPHYRGYQYAEGEILSPDGHCRPFDADAKGTVFGSGAGVVVLRRLRDAVENGDFIHAVIRGSAINNDGNRKVGYLAPSVDGQVDCIAEALAVANLEAGQISYVECHGTGTAVGDPIEVAALTQAFGEHAGAEKYCGLGSVKSNIGHLDTAAGVASLVKVVEMLKHEQIVPTLHFRAPNPNIPFARTPFYVASAARGWPRGAAPRRAGVSSLGVGGTNAHVIVEEARPRTYADAAPSPQVLLLSARSRGSLDAAAVRLADHLERTSGLSLRDVSRTLLARRRLFTETRVVVASDVATACAKLRLPASSAVLHKPEGKRPVIFACPGGGAQHVNMARGVYATQAAFRDKLDACFALLKSAHSIDLAPVLFPTSGHEDAAQAALERPSLALPALFSVTLAYAAQLRSWGITPDAVVGHSVGEYAAAELAGVLSFEAAIGLVVLRGRLFERVEPGGMLSVPLAAEALGPMLGDELAIAAINGPELCVISGRTAALSALAERLRADGVESQRLHIHIAAHSPLLDPILPAFAEALARISFRAPRLPIAGNLTGSFYPSEHAPTADDFVKHLREAVRFSDCIAALRQRFPDGAVLEVGPGQALSSLVRSAAGPGSALVSLSVSPHAKDRTSAEEQLHVAFGTLFAAGCKCDLGAYFNGEAALSVPLPTTPFEHERHWIEPGTGFFMAATEGPSVSRAAEPRDAFSVLTMEAASPSEPATAAGSVVLVVGEQDAALSRKSREVLLARGASVRSAQVADAVQALDAMIAAGTSPSHVLYLGAHGLHAAMEHREAEERAFYGLVALARRWAQEDLHQGVELLVVTDGAIEVGDDEVRNPFQALALGPVRVIPREVPELRVRLLDADASSACAVVDELFAPGTASVTALREQRRYEEQLVAHTLEGSAIDGLPHGAVCIVTGGFGGMARVLCEQLETACRARIVLVGRSAPRDPGALAEFASRNIRAHVADVTDRDAMTAVFARTEAEIGPIDLVLHAAGSLDDAPFMLKERATMARVLAPKVSGFDTVRALSVQHGVPRCIVIGSTSAFLGLPGQVDYAAANAYVAARCSAAGASATRFTSLGFGTWRESGMAARSYGQKAEIPCGPSDLHPWLGSEHALGEGGFRFSRTWSTSDWVLDQHRIRGVGAVFPGTGYVELVRAAAARVLSPSREEALEIRDLAFLAPLGVSDGQMVRIDVETHAARGGALSVVVRSRLGSSMQSTEHARATVRSVGARREIVPACAVPLRSFDPASERLPQEDRLDFGEEWKVLRAYCLSGHEGYACLVSPGGATARTLHVHPGVLDIATGFAFGLVSDAGLRIPVGYEKIVIHAPMQGELTAHVCCTAHDATAGTAVFSLRLCDASGRCVLDAHGYTTRAIAGGALEAMRPHPPEAMPAWRSDGLSDAEGAATFALALSHALPHAVYVSAAPLRLPRLERTPLRTADPAQRASAEPQADALSQSIAGYWCSLLGVTDVRAGDNFFDLGGHSLVAVRLFARIKRELGADLPLSALFERPTLGGFSAMVRSALGPGSQVPAAVPAESPLPTRAGPLVLIHPGQKGRIIYCVHGAGGNVLNFHELGRSLGPDLTLYGLEAPGVDGGKPLTTIEAMAELYLEAIRQVQPQGPYHLSGYSGGGVVAYEIAHRLQVAGQEVRSLQLLDTFHPGIVPQHRPLMERLRKLALRGPVDALRFLRLRAAERASEQKRDEALALFLQYDVAMPWELRELHLTRTFTAAARQYRPQPYAGRVTLYRAEHIADVFTHAGSRLGWRDLIQDLDVVVVAGDHDSLVRPPNVDTLAAHIRARVLGT
jgi:acyl transferase domain-containing protein/thioesterase domain-containing protein/aryl carrier-like protein